LLYRSTSLSTLQGAEHTI